MGEQNVALRTRTTKQDVFLLARVRLCLCEYACASTPVLVRVRLYPSVLPQEFLFRVSTRLPCVRLKTAVVPHRLVAVHSECQMFFTPVLYCGFNDWFKRISRWRTYEEGRSVCCMYSFVKQGKTGREMGKRWKYFLPFPLPSTVRISTRTRNFMYQKPSRSLNLFAAPGFTSSITM